MTEAATKTVILATGGTGGHVFPATAVAEQLLERGYQVVISTDARGARYLPGKFDRAVIQAASPSGSLAKKLAGLWALAAGSLQALALIWRCKPKLVIGFGSYAMMPAIIAAAAMRVPIILHEQNAIVGRAHRSAARFARSLVLSHQPPEDLPTSLTDMSVVTGNPVRAAFAKAKDYVAPAGDQPIKIVVFGGSQGARIFGEPMAKAFASLSSAVQGRLVIHHQVRDEDLPAVRKIYAATAGKVHLAAFFDEPHKLMEHAHLIISRAGATIIAELTALGRPAILVPFAGSLEQDQMGNARNLAGHGGAVLLTEKDYPNEINRVLNILFKDPSRLGHMAEIAKKLGRPQAAAALADIAQSLIERDIVPTAPDAAS